MLSPVLHIADYLAAPYLIALPEGSKGGQMGIHGGDSAAVVDHNVVAEGTHIGEFQQHNAIHRRVNRRPRIRSEIHAGVDRGHNCGAQIRW